MGYLYKGIPHRDDPAAQHSSADAQPGAWVVSKRTSLRNEGRERTQGVEYVFTRIHSGLNTHM